MLSQILRTSVAAAALAVAPALAHAQQAEPAGTAAPASEAPTEVQQLQARLQELQQKATQDPQVQASSAQLTAAVTAAIEAADPAAKAGLERAKTLRTDVAAAQAAGDNEKLHALAAEAQQLQQVIAAARAKAMTTPEVVKAREAYTAELFKKMVEIDPETQKLVERLNELRKQ